ncbi:MAG: glycosyltransferase [Planctomycetales bacterium]|nr:glycosyltransferase [Planctomycetales bacterium]
MIGFGTQPTDADKSAERPVVCQLLHTLNVGGAELLAQQFALRAAKQFRPVFVCLDALGSLGGQLRQQGFTVEVLQRRPGFDSRCAWRLANVLRREKVQLVHAHQYAPFFYSALARLCGAHYPILFTEHGRDFPDFRRPKRVLANRLLLRRCDHVVAVGNYVRTALVDHEGLSAKRIEVIYNGVDASRFDPQRALREIVRRELRLQEDEFAIVQVARLNRLKDYGTALRAIAQVCRVYPQVRYFLVGEGEEQATLQRLRQDLGLQRQVTMLGPRSDVPRLLQGMDLFLLTSVSEGIPLTLIEAMFSQLPCVATGVGGVPEVVVHGQTGWVVAPQRPDELAAGILKLVQADELRQRLAAAGYLRASRHFPATRMIAEYERRYAQLIAPRWVKHRGVSAAR